MDAKAKPGMTSVAAQLFDKEEVVGRRVDPRIKSGDGHDGQDIALLSLIPRYPRSTARLLMSRRQKPPGQSMRSTAR